MTSQKQGWLYKQGGITNGWKKKYCVLQHNILLIFDKETNLNKTPAKTSINLLDCTIRLAEGLHKFGFQLNLPNHKKKQMAFAAMNASELKEWIEVIKEVSKPIKSVKSTDINEKEIPGRWDPVNNNNNNIKIIMSPPSPSTVIQNETQQKYNYLQSTQNIKQDNFIKPSTQFRYADLLFPSVPTSEPGSQTGNNNK